MEGGGSSPFFSRRPFLTFDYMEKIKALGRDIGVAVYRYYGLLLVALVATGAFIAESVERSDSEALLKLGWLGLLGIALLFALHIAQQRYRIRWPLPLVGFIILGLYYLLLPEIGANRNRPVPVIVLGVSAIVFHLLVAIIPFMKRGDNEGFWDYNKSLFINAVQTAVFTLVLWGGLALAVVAVENLFGVRVGSRFWERMAYTILIFGSSLIFTLFAKDGLVTLRTSVPYPPVLRFFVQYVLVPLLVVYLVILYSYGMKIVLEWDLPKGWVSYLVLAYSALGLLSLLLLHPLHGAGEKVWVRFFARSFYLTLLPLLVLLFVAIGVRVAAYGVTENRYFVLVLACWLLAIAGYQLTRQQHGIKVIPASLFVIGVLCLWLPFANVFAVSYRSQRQRLHTLLEAHALLDSAGKVDFSQQVKRTDLNDIASVFHYLKTRDKHRVIKSLIPETHAVRVDTVLDGRWTSDYDFANLFTHVVEDGSRAGVTYSVLKSANTGGYDRLHDTRGYDYLIPRLQLGTDYAQRDYVFGPDSVKLEVGVKYPDNASRRQRDSPCYNIALREPAAGTVYSYNIAPVLDSLYARYADRLFVRSDIVLETPPVSFRLGGYEFEWRFEEITFDRTGVDGPLPELRNSLRTSVVAELLIRKVH